MASPATYDYGYAVNPWYRRKALTGIAPDVSQIYGLTSAITQDKRERDFAGARLAEEKRRTDLMRDDLEFSKDQARFQNIADLTSTAVGGYAAYKYFNPAKKPGLAPGLPPGATDLGSEMPWLAGSQETALAPGLSPTGNYTNLSIPKGYGLPTMEGTRIPLAGDLTAPMATQSLAPMDFSVPFEESGYATLSKQGAAGAGGEMSLSAGGGGEFFAAEAAETEALAPGVAGAEAAAAPVASTLAVAGAGLAGAIGGKVLGHGLSKVLGTHPKTTEDVMSVAGTFTAVTLATGGNFVIGGLAAAGVALLEVFDIF